MFHPFWFMTDLTIETQIPFNVSFIPFHKDFSIWLDENFVRYDAHFNVSGKEFILQHLLISCVPPTSYINLPFYSINNPVLNIYSGQPCAES